MCNCQTTAASLETTTLATHKRVHYALGLVLGVDEFQQEQLYFMERDRLLTRALHGYGTVHGLAVSVRPSTDGPEVVVAPGMAVDPHGRHVCVSLAQCASVHGWLNRASVRAALEEQLGSAPGSVEASLVLCYREGLADQVPVPGGPCRSQEESMVASRIADDFELQLTFDPPPHVEEAAVRRFGALLEAIEIDALAPGLTEEELMELVRALAPAAGSPPSPGEETDSPPAGLTLHPDRACDLLRAAFRVWVTEVRPKLLGPGCCGGAAPKDDCVLLARLEMGVTRDDAGRYRVAELDEEEGPDLRLREDDRPYLLATRLLQELATCARLDDEEVADHGALRGLEEDDHEQYLHRDGLRPMNADLAMAGHRVTGLAAATAGGEAMPHGQAAGGDLSGSYPAPAVVALQGRAVDPMTDGTATAPADAQVLTWNEPAARWEPRDVPEPDVPSGLTLEEIADRLPAIPFATIAPEPPAREQDPAALAFRVWFHLNAGPALPEDNLPALVPDFFVEVFGEQNGRGSAARPFLSPIPVRSVTPVSRNVFRIVLDRDGVLKTPLLRFRFDTTVMRLTTGSDTMALAEWVMKRPVKWTGHDGAGIVTVFVEGTPPSPAGGYAAVGAGRFNETGQNMDRALNDLRAQPAGRNQFRLSFPGYDPKANYVVTGAPLVDRDGKDIFAFEVVYPFEDGGIVVRTASARALNETGFMVQIFQIL